MKTGNFKFYLPNDNSINQNNFILNVTLHPNANLTFDYVGFNYNLTSLKFYVIYVNCNHGFLEFAWHQTWKRLILSVRQCRTKKYDLEKRISSYEYIDYKYIKFLQIYDNLKYDSFCGFSYNAINALPCNSSNIATQTYKPSIITYKSTNGERSKTRSGLYVSNVGKTIIESFSATSDIEAFDGDFTVMETTGQITSGTYISENIKPTFLNDENKWLLIGIISAVLVLFTVIIPTVGFLIKKRKKKTDNDSESTDSVNFSSSESSPIS
jgi:hypothetical protein